MSELRPLLAAWVVNLVASGKDGAELAAESLMHWIFDLGFETLHEVHLLRCTFCDPTVFPPGLDERAGGAVESLGRHERPLVNHQFDKDQ